MANGWRANGNVPHFTTDEEEAVEKATRRIAGAFGYGSAWTAQTVHHSHDAFVSGDVSRAETLNVAHRGHVDETAARKGRWTNTHVRRQHRWAIHGGIVALPCSTPDPEGQAALSYAQLAPHEHHVLIAYALEDINAWYQAEPYAVAYAQVDSVMAARDAMARMMYRASATSIDDRAAQLRIKASRYRAQTRRAEFVLRGWLVRASEKFNAMRSPQPTLLGSSQPNGMRSFTAWDNKEYLRSRDWPCRTISGTDLHPANDIDIRDVRNSSAKDEQCPSCADPRIDRPGLLAA